MRHRVTPRTPGIVQQLRRLAADVDPYVSLASPDARAEWAELCASWPSELDLHSGWIELSEEDLEATQARIRRFGEIVRALGGAMASAKAGPAGASSFDSPSRRPARVSRPGEPGI
jgi:CelD/BcsL family acetyltransferase involved in cellulose biosynthesis